MYTKSPLKSVPYFFEIIFNIQYLWLLFKFKLRLQTIKKNPYDAIWTVFYQGGFSFKYREVDMFHLIKL